MRDRSEFTVPRSLTGALLLSLGLVGCGAGGRSADSTLQGTIDIDGSSTVFPISEAVAEEFMAAGNRGVRVTVGVSGTGGGFKRFCAGETALGNASRPIKEAERELCAQNGIEYLEIPVAFDGIAVVTHADNAFAACLTTGELRRIWEPESGVHQWSDLRPEWPAQPIQLYGPGPNNGTFDYFTDAIVGKEGSARSDYTASADANILVQGVSGDAGSLGYFGFAYYEHNQKRLKLLEIDDGQGCVKPSRQTIEEGSYTPLSRPLFVYLNRAALQRPEVLAFARFYLEHAPVLAPEAGYVPLAAAAYRQGLEMIEEGAGAAGQ
jgi:phosphate transport system substrate-binding protein